MKVRCTSCGEDGDSQYPCIGGILPRLGSTHLGCTARNEMGGPTGIWRKAHTDAEVADAVVASLSAMAYGCGQQQLAAAQFGQDAMQRYAQAAMQSQRPFPCEGCGEDLSGSDMAHKCATHTIVPIVGPRGTIYAVREPTEHERRMRALDGTDRGEAEMRERIREEERDARRFIDHATCPGSIVAYDEAVQRANALADECGALKQENTELLAENARLRRRLDK